MVELLTLTVENRETVGKRRNRRLRESGKVPAILYGHKKAVVNLSVSVEQIDAALRHGSRFVKLAGAVAERAFIKEVQWNVWGEAVLHVDFTRVGEHERVRLSVPLELRGEAPGIKDGGVVKQHLHMLEIETDPTSAPEGIPVHLGKLGFNEQIRVADLVLPEGVKSLEPEETLVVECVEPIIIEEAETEAAPAEGTEAEPEVIGRKKTDEEKEEEK